MSKYLPKSWVDDRLTVKNSPINGRGLFAKSIIKEGDVVEIFGGTLFTEKEIHKGKHRAYTALKIADDLYLAMPKGSEETTIDEFTNHSCDPTCWLRDEVTLVAKRDINPGEEITMDYSTWDNEPGYIYFTDCHCGSTFCRHSITGDDWKRKDLQERYKDHFSPFIQREIDKLN